jgi:hypothetical protein
MGNALRRPQEKGEIQMMKNLQIKVRTVQEFEAIKRAMKDKEIRAFVTIIGFLKPLPTDEHRRFVLETVQRLFELEKL